MPLRRRILIVTVALFVVGLGVANFATYQFLSSFLTGRIDDQLRGATGAAEARLTRAAPLHSGEHGLSLPDGSYAALLDGEGRVQREVRFDSGERAPRARVPGALIRSPEPRLATVRAASGPTEYRLLAKTLGNQEAIVVAMPLTEVRATQHRLLLIEGLVSGLVLTAIGAAAYWLTRRELSPLERMARKSRAIAAGDLSQRVEPDDPRTEVGQLGAALNAMLAEIERAFDDRVAAEERLRRFVADASHELRTPVTSIRGFAELFRRGASGRPSDLANVMRRIEQEGERMGELVEELLLLAHLDQGQPLEQQPVELAAVVDAAVDAARAADPGRPLKVDSQGPLVVLGAESRLRQVVDNLLTNARVHTPSGTPIDVRVGTEDRQVVLEVADEGAGVPAEEADRIFERFYRTDRSRTRSRGGVGLGLSIVRSVVEAHGGVVGYFARPGGGAVFRVTLPQSSAAHDRDRHSKAAPASG
ncbi:MAG TPA: HAMP domain-containing sensor histidine kinase [Gaiellaceae bacterium]|nr:HAMP domain-containing sensor histidine kinase [Gaiellaceae bacterium]